MTPGTAQAIFIALFNSLQENNFQDVGTYLISRELNNLTFSENTNRALEELYQSAQNPENSVQSLRLLIYATRAYFDAARSLPEVYEREVNRFQTAGSTRPPELNISFGNSDIQTNIIGVLNNPSISELLKTVDTIAEFLENDDQEFFINLNRSL